MVLEVSNPIRTRSIIYKESKLIGYKIGFKSYKDSFYYNYN